jgi:serine/threonine protein kinase
MEVLGLPPKRLMDQSTRKKLFFDHSGAPRIQVTHANSAIARTMWLFQCTHTMISAYDPCTLCSRMHYMVVSVHSHDCFRIRHQPNSRGKKRMPGTKDLMSAVKCSDPLFIDFLRCCLHWDPKLRYSPDDALQHDWILEATHPTPRAPLTLLTQQKETLARNRHKGSTKGMEIPK